MHPDKFKQVAGLPSAERHAYFVRKAADTQEVWGLYRDGWATAQVDGKVAIPFWPEAAFAQACASGDWEHFQPRAIALGDFLAKWLPGMNQNGQLAFVFPVPQGSASIAAPADLLRDLQHESEQYE
ncbi:MULTISPECIES: DUF2750 domain-containing protein [Janthinobacterium]|uniref:DUF2750 domain-containing protein n=1 Tax=Janthinobacterium TaxID=29580 RepID=UPI00053847FE|nr:MULTISPECIES: DUF2750 domain-containing protein [Janthinobacterium]KHA78433.1 hypothetical protein NC77_12720 [Janthinobacterium lividum]PHV51516.1 DUF2750 domain-containing protein [Janthinobacterium sp. BJB301]QKY04264.1 DUF2750 domain-containing protein [Janthinobacterium lividum]QKY09882.1 DUF2750 domain-containing protein [Janthinobacterium lividum]